MTATTEQNHELLNITFRLLSIGGAIAALLGVASLAVGRFGAVVGLPLIFGGLGLIAFSLLFQLLSKLVELLTEIASHLAAIRSQMEKGVFGLLGR
jgi:hypothetical protein